MNLYGMAAKPTDISISTDMTQLSITYLTNQLFPFDGTHTISQSLHTSTHTILL